MIGEFYMEKSHKNHKSYYYDSVDYDIMSKLSYQELSRYAEALEAEYGGKSLEKKGEKACK